MDRLGALGSIPRIYSSMLSRAVKISVLETIPMTSPSLETTGSLLTLYLSMMAAASPTELVCLMVLAGADMMSATDLPLLLRSFLDTMPTQTPSLSTTGTPETWSKSFFTDWERRAFALSVRVRDLAESGRARACV